MVHKISFRFLYSNCAKWTHNGEVYSVRIHHFRIYSIDLDKIWYRVCTRNCGGEL